MTVEGSGKLKRWDRALREHRDALSSFLESVSELPPDAWREPVAEGKWSPAEITEHLALGYAAAIQELESGAAMAARLSPARQKVLRWFLLPHILYHRKMPRVRAPREVRPAQVSDDPAAGVDRLLALAGDFEARYTARPDGRLTHPFFGSLDRVQTVRLCALHLEHHQRQLGGAHTNTAGSDRSARG